MKFSFFQKFRFSEIRRDKWQVSVGKLSGRETLWLKIRQLVYFLYIMIKFTVSFPVLTVRFIAGLVQLLDELERLHFSPLRKIHRGKDCVIDRQTWLANGENIQLGDFVKISAFSSVIAGNVSTIKIGSNTIIGPGVTIVSINHDYKLNEIPIRYQGFKDTEKNSIIVGNDVWLGTNVVVLPGAVIGDGSIIGAGVVVRGIVPPKTVVYNRANIERKER
jgi:acetyltransferase-like isoleucine patch superfamily enzyme